jgi:hypothetical protein
MSNDQSSPFAKFITYLSCDRQELLVQVDRFCIVPFSSIEKLGRKLAADPSRLGSFLPGRE